MRIRYQLLVGGMLGVLAGCSADPEVSVREAADDTGVQAANDDAADRRGATGGMVGKQAVSIDDGGAVCRPQTCAEVGYACGQFRSCGFTITCADEGLTCGPSAFCVGGLHGEPTQCQPSIGCDVCDAIPNCIDEDQPTRLTGRVITAGREDSGESANQIGVPNAIVYISRTTDPADLPDIPQGIPSGEARCDRCEDQALGPVLLGAVTDAAGNFELQGPIPIDREFLLVVKAGKFRRAIRYSLPQEARCQTTALPTTLPGNPTRLPRSSSDGLAAHLPRVAISTGKVDAMECVFEKMGIAHDEFGNPGPDGAGDARIHLYRGGRDGNAPEGAHMPGGDTPYDAALYGDQAQMQSYDMIVSNCEGGGSWDGPPDASSNFPQRMNWGDNVREFVNRGGRMFASHLGFSWLAGNGSAEYDQNDPIATGLDRAATWEIPFNQSDSGAVEVSLHSPDASPRIQNFADWCENEGITDQDGRFTIEQPRSQSLSLGSSSEEFVRGVTSDQASVATRVQQFSFNTPYGAPEGESCGRVAYSGFHVAVGTREHVYLDVTFPEHCTDAYANDGVLTNQEKVLLYMLFDLGACVGTIPDTPTCVPLECGDMCGHPADGCGNVLDCGLCPIN